jgi:hypothetical protein
MSKNTRSIFKLTQAQSNLLAGAATVIDVIPARFYVARLPQFDRTDLEALSSDWVRVGNDMRAVANLPPDVVKQKAA